MIELQYNLSNTLIYNNMGRGKKKSLSAKTADRDLVGC
jgi:hypothetical protein